MDALPGDPGLCDAEWAVDVPVEHDEVGALPGRIRPRSSDCSPASAAPAVQSRSHVAREVWSGASIAPAHVSRPRTGTARWAVPSRNREVRRRRQEHRGWRARRRGARSLAPYQADREVAHVVDEPGLHHPCDPEATHPVDVARAGESHVLDTRRDRARGPGWLRSTRRAQPQADVADGVHRDAELRGRLPHGCPRRAPA